MFKMTIDGVTNIDGRGTVVWGKSNGESGLRVNEEIEIAGDGFRSQFTVIGVEVPGKFAYNGDTVGICIRKKEDESQIMKDFVVRVIDNPIDVMEDICSKG